MRFAYNPLSHHTPDYLYWFVSIPVPQLSGQFFQAYIKYSEWLIQV